MRIDRLVRSTRSSARGFTLVEMIVVTLLLLIAMVGLLSVFDASARINKNETDVADAQGAVRYGVYQMTRVIRMAGAGGLYVTQAVLNHADRGLPGINPTGAGASYDNVASGVTVDDWITGAPIQVRPGTDMIEIRGVILSPLLGFDQQTGCNGCTGSQDLSVLPIVGDTIIGQHVNNDAANRPQFAAIDAYTAAASGTRPMLVVVEDGNTDLHAGCSDPTPGGVTRYPQPLYNVGQITTQTRLVTSNSFGTVDFGGTIPPRFNVELPSSSTGENAQPIQKIRRAGIMDDIIFFIALDPTNDPQGFHPYLAQGIRRGARFAVTRLADDVEDMQIGYGMDSDGDGAVTRLPASAGCPIVDIFSDPDSNASVVAGCDEWAPNVPGESAPDDAQFQAEDPFLPGHTGVPLARHCPTLHGVMISLVAKARDADPTYRGPAAQGYQKVMNSTATPVGPGNYRRRIQTLRVNLRNYQFQG